MKRRVLNNFFVNFLRNKFDFIDSLIKHRNPYSQFTINDTKSIQENAGYSVRPEINEVLTKSKTDLLSSVKVYVRHYETILDIGCGPGMYLELFNDLSFKLVATDINKSMINTAKLVVPKASFVEGNFLDISFDARFKFIYCIGVLIYIPRTQIENFIKKIHSLLEEDGILYLNYPHAISWLDVVYNDLSYIQYSPKRIARWIEPYFEIIKHEHAFDGRIINYYDSKPYKSLNPNANRTYKNSYLLIAKKKST